MTQTFQRFEKKYLLEPKQYQFLLEKLQPYIEQDKFYLSSIRSIYYDTPRFELIRRSIEKPKYKEKLRIRSYAEPEKDDELVFVEFKKKFDGIVYKRRTKAAYKAVLEDIDHCEFQDEQIRKEIRYALNYYKKLQPAIYIGCTRTSYTGKQDKLLRITFDQNIVYRVKDLSLKSSEKDKPVTDKIVMELKVGQAMPLWLVHILNEAEAYPRGFSKVGTAFLKEIKGE